MYIHVYVYIYIYIYMYIHKHTPRGIAARAPHSMWSRGVASQVLDVSHETPDVAPCRISPPMPFCRTCLARNA